ncbi:MAG TPA: hypothetical protein VFK86_11355 [Bauldia sp.]|nr:hypothetical protein [Bauldia sp.]
MITLAEHHDAGRKAKHPLARLGGALLLVGLALGGAGCTQTTSQAVSEPVVGGPLVLNSAPGATVAPNALAPATTPASEPGSTAAQAPAPAPVAPAPVAAAKPAPAEPLPVTAPEPAPATTSASSAPEPLPTTAPDDGEFPNINKAPAEPGGTLLPAEERARIIAELEALRARQTAPPAAAGGDPSDLAEQAQTHGQAAIEQIEACSEEGAMENNPACAPAD